MLDPDDRRLLSDQLMAPPGFDLTDGLICTYSLDLTALAGVPLAFLQIDPLELGDDIAARITAIAAVREWSERLTVVCQAGAIHVPAEWRDAFLWLESAVVQVTPRQARAVFHPKLWVLRFRRDDEIRYRLLVVSRNLTYDRSWDVIARLDGPVTPRQNAIRANTPLVQFIQGLGDEDLPMVGAVADRHLARQSLFTQELRTVRFSTDDEAVKGWAFWPIGIGGHRYQLDQLFTGHRSPFQTWAGSAANRSGRRMLVVSPFLSSALLRTLAVAHFDIKLVARQDALDECEEHLPDVWFSEGQPGVHEFLDGLGVDGAPLSGLHAKLWVADDGWDAHVWLGSANATEAAFTRNVEFLLQLTGPRSRFGVDAVSGQEGLGALTTPYIRPDAAADAEVVAFRQRQRELAWKLTEVITSGRLLARVDAVDNAHWDLSLTLADAGALCLGPDTVQWRARPMTLPSERAVAGEAGLVMYRGLAVHELSLFWSVELYVLGTELRAEAAVRLEPAGAMPSFESRESAAVSRHLNSTDSLTLYLEFLLAGGDWSLTKRLRRQRGRGGKADASFSYSGRPLFETLLHALATQPEALSSVIDLIESADTNACGLQQDPEFQQVWAAFIGAQRLIAATSRTGEP